MSNLIEVKEFDTIAKNQDYKDQYIFLEEKSFEELYKYILSSDSGSSESDVLDFVKLGYNRNIVRTITFKNYVGLIQVNDKLQIQILPKIASLKDDKDKTKTKEIFLKMLRSMKDFPCKSFTKANLNIKKMNLYEIFINMYIQEVLHLVKRGIKSDYVNCEDNLPVYKGKLLVNEHLKHNYMHKERFYVSFDEYKENRPENKLVKSTLLKLQKLANSFENSKNIRQLLTFFELVDPSSNYDQDFSRVLINRNTKDYDNLIKWSKVFLKNRSFTTFSGDNSSSALLFPMEKLFESYVAQSLRKVLPEGWSMLCQEKKHYLFEKLNDDKYRRFSLIPDIVLRFNNDKEKRTVILDTKWKRLNNKKVCNYGISQSDMYQMYAYSKKYGTKEIWLLYPANEQMRAETNIKFDSGDGTVVSLFFVDLENEQQSLNNLVNLVGLN